MSADGSAVASTDGLTSAQVAQRRARVGRNVLPTPRRRPLVLRVVDQLREPMNLLLLAAAAIAGFALGERLDGLAIGAIVVLNASIALVQEGRAGRALAALEELSTPEATVVRDGHPRRIDAADIVPGDLVRVAAGDRVPADAQLVGAELLEVDESMLTGESLPVRKAVTGETDGGELRWGTFVTGGTGSAVVTATGAATDLGRIAAGLDVVPPATPLQQELGRLSARLGIAAVVVATLVFAITLLRLGISVQGVERAFLVAVALAVAAVPEGLPTVTLVALAAGVRRMAQHGAIVRRLPAVETLGSASVIVTDKTGTITENRMRVTSAWSLDAPTEHVERLAPTVRLAAAHIAAVANDACLRPPSGDPMELALLRFAAPSPTHRDTRLASFPVDSQRMRMTVLHPHPTGIEVATKGAPEGLLGCCTHALRDDGAHTPLSTGDRARILARAEAMAAAGTRVLALARGVRRELPSDAGAAERGLTFVALVGLEDPVRDGAAAAVAASVAAGIHLVMATGDHPATARAIARDVGLVGGGLSSDGSTITGPRIAAEGWPDDPLATRVYARLEPTQKLELVRALQRRGEIVAMTGDGANDAPALRNADIGVALGQRGSDLAREVADLVVTDDQLATIVTATREGRGIYDNVRKVVDYLVAGNLSEVGVVVGALLLMPWLGVPLLPLQLLWVNLLTDGLPALALGNDRHDRRLMTAPPRPRSMHLLDRHRLTHLAVRGGLMAAACLATGYAAATRSPDPDHVRTVLLTTLVTTHLLVAFVARQPARASWRDRLAPAGWVGTRWLLAAVLAGLALHLVVLVWAPAQAVFRTTTPTGSDWTLIAAGTLVGVLATAIHRRLSGGTSALAPGERADGARRRTADHPQAVDHPEAADHPEAVDR